MRRYVSQGIFVLSTALLILTVLGWVRSYFPWNRWIYHSWRYEGGFGYWYQDSLQIGRGGLGFNRIVQSGEVTWYNPLNKEGYSGVSRRGLNRLPRPAKYPNFHFKSFEDASRFGFDWGYFGHREPDGRYRAYGYQLIVPIWLIVVLLAIAPLSRWWQWRRWRRRLAANLCRVCAYDLRFSPERCPECGTEVVAPVR